MAFKSAWSFSEMLIDSPPPSPDARGGCQRTKFSRAERSGAVRILVKPHHLHEFLTRFILAFYGNPSFVWFGFISYKSVRWLVVRIEHIHRCDIYFFFSGYHDKQFLFTIFPKVFHLVIRAREQVQAQQKNMLNKQTSVNQI